MPEPVPPEIRMLARICAAILQKPRHRLRQVPLPHHDIERDVLLGEFADRDGAAIQHDRRQHDVDAAAVGEPGVDQRARLVDAAADRRGDALRDIDDMLHVAEPRVGPFELAAPLDIDIVRPVDEDVGDLVVVEKRLERTQADHVVGEFGREQVLFALVELDPLLGRDLLNELGDLVLQRRSRQPRRRRRIDPRHQQVPDPLLDVAADRGPGSRPVAAIPWNDDKLVTRRADDPAPEGASHRRLHQPRRFASRPYSVAASAAIPCGKRPRRAAGGCPGS